jgi:hyperosmotically inducible periplasmic protein
MKNIIVSLGLLATAACSHQSRPVDEPVVYVDPSAEVEDPLGGPSTRPASTVEVSTRTLRPVDNQFGSIPATSNNTSYSGAASPSNSVSLPAPSASAFAVGVASSSPDNTGVNKRDQNNNTLTPIDQSNKQSDLDITQAIRKAVIAKDGFSFNAKNVKIITVSGKVTLRGPVSSAAERTSIANIAKQTAGVVNVDDQLEVKP